MRTPVFFADQNFGIAACDLKWQQKVCCCNLCTAIANPCEAMACSAGGLRVWECTLQGIGWQRERAGNTSASKTSFCKRLLKLESAGRFRNGGFDHCALCLHTKSRRVSRWKVKPGSKGYVCKDQAEGRRRTVISAYLEEEKDQMVNGKVRLQLSSLQSLCRVGLFR